MTKEKAKTRDMEDNNKGGGPSITNTIVSKFRAKKDKASTPERVILTIGFFKNAQIHFYCSGELSVFGLEVYISSLRKKDWGFLPLVYIKKFRLKKAFRI